jgi:hypothetical protein
VFDISNPPRLPLIRNFQLPAAAHAVPPRFRAEEIHRFASAIAELRPGFTAALGSEISHLQFELAAPRRRAAVEDPRLLDAPRCSYSS